MYSTKSKPCPRCGGTDRYYHMPTAKFANNAAIWRCGQCERWELATPASDSEDIPKVEVFTDEQREGIYNAYGVVTSFCQELLWHHEGHEALAYLRERGFSDYTIREARLGFHPAPDKRGNYPVGPHLSHLSKEIYEAAKLGGLISPEGRLNRVLKGVITIPYQNQSGEVTLLRSRSLDDNARAKYLSPAGVTLYAGGIPIFYLDNLLKDQQKLILTEGEFKALLPTQHWENSEISLPAIGTPGLAYMPDAFLDRLAGKTVYIVYDVEARKDPFKLSPGERFSLRNGRKLMGLNISAQIGILEKQLEKATKKKRFEDKDRIEKELEPLRVELAKATARKIKVKIIRFPRWPHEKKIDLDGWLLEHGPQKLEELISQAQEFREWQWAHGKQRFAWMNGGIYKGSKQLANFQAVMTANVIKYDGIEQELYHRFTIRTPSRAIRKVEIPSRIWSKDVSSALAALKIAMLEGTARDEGKLTIDAIKQLSQHGDDPLQIVSYAVTGWQNIRSWHYLVPDGAINASGPTTRYHADIQQANGLHHKLLVDGLASKGWEGFQMLLWGQVCPQPLALIMLSHAALALIHRWLGTSARSGIWLYGESGTQKSALNRIVLALWGKDFTAIRSDGRPLAKWSGNYVGLELTAYAACDLLFSFDDYKEATARKGTLATFLHDYSESSSRARGRADLKLQRNFPPRGLALFSGESVPSGDTGQIGRLLPWQIGRGDVDLDVLAEMQIIAVKGHYTVFWAEFIQWIAKKVDLGEKLWRQKLSDLALEDTEALPTEHDRVAEALRQNRIGWRILTEWLYEAKYISDSQLAELGNAYHNARHTIAGQQSCLMQQERPADKLLNILSEMITTGDAVLQGNPIPGYGPEPTPGYCPNCGKEEGAGFYLIRQCQAVDGQPGWHCTSCVDFWLADPEDLKRPDGYPVKANAQIIGFYHNGYKGEGIALLPEAAFTLVQRTLRSRGERLKYRSNDIWSQMMNQDYLARTGTDPKRSKWLVRLRHPLTKAFHRVVLVKPCKILASQEAE